jgi:RNA polymerase sigma factor (sigma-70 family)
VTVTGEVRGMATNNGLTRLVQKMRRQFGDATPDGDLLADFAFRRDEAAFAELVARHGPLVLGVARRHLPDRHAAEDVVQATFAALARTAGRLGRPPSLVNWLYTVAIRQARKARLRYARQAARLQRLPSPAAVVDPLAVASGRELVGVIDDELGGLPAAYRLPLLLCAVEGLSREEAARKLGWPAGSVKGRLERGRELLRRRLARRGLTVPAILAGGRLAAPAEALPPAIVQTVTRAALAAPAASRLWPAALVLLAATLGVGIHLASGSAPQPTTPSPPPAADAVPPTDVLGDPLPRGAVARLGTGRLRPGAGIEALAYSPDGTKLACWSGSHENRGALTIWDAKDGRLSRRVELPKAQAKLLRWLPDGRGVAVLRLDEDDYFVWDFADPAAPLPPTKPNSRLNVSRVGEICSLAVSNDGRWLATGQKAQAGENRPIDLWDLGFDRPLSALHRRKLGELPGHGYQLAFTPDGRALYALGRTQQRDQSVLPPPGGGPIPIMPGRRADTAKLARFEISTGVEQVSAEIPAPGGSFFTHLPYSATVLVSPDGRNLVTVHQDGTIRVWDTDASREIRSWEIEPVTANPNRRAMPLTGIAVSSDGRTLLMSDGFDGLRRWDVGTGKETGIAKPSRQNLQALAVSPDGKQVAAGDTMGDVRLFDAATMEDRARRPGHENLIDNIHVLPDGKTALTAAADGTVRRWDLDTGRETRRTTLETPGFSWSTGFTNDGRGLVGRNYWGAPGRGVSAIYSRHEKYYWNVETGKRMALAEAIADPKQWILSGPAADRLLCVNLNDQFVTLRDWPTGRVRQSFAQPGGSYGTTAAAISPDGSAVAVAGEESSGGLRNAGVVTIFDSATGEPKHRVHSFQALPSTLAALPDGSGFIIGSQVTTAPWAAGRPQPPYPSDQALVEYSATTGEQVRQFVPPNRPAGQYRSVSALAVSRDGRLLGAAEDDFGVYVYETATGKLRCQFKGHRNNVTALAFTPDGRRLISASRDLTGLVWDVDR